MLRGWMLPVLTAALPGALFTAAFALSVTTAPPGAEVTVTGHGARRWQGNTPWQVELEPGAYRVRVEMAGYEAHRETIDFTSSDALRICLNEVGQKFRCRRILPCAGKPKSVFVNGDGSRVWAALLPKQPSLQVFNGLSGERLQTIQLDEYGGVELLPAPDGERIWVSQMQSARVYELHRQSFAILRRFDTGGTWSKVLELSRDERSLFVANWLSHDVSEIDLANGTLRRRIATVRTPRGLYAAPDGEHLYVAGFGRGELQKIKLATGEGKTLRRTGGAVRHLAADEKRGRLYVSDMGSETIFVLDLTSDRLEPLARTIEDPNTIALSPDGRLLFVSTRGKTGRFGYMYPGPEWGAVLVFDALSGDLLATLVGGNQPTALALSADGRLLVFSDFLDRVLRVYAVPSYAELAAGPRPTLAHLRPRLKKPPALLDAEAKVSRALKRQKALERKKAEVSPKAARAIQP